MQKEPGLRAGYLRPGRHLGHYEVLEFVRAGGMGEVYRARDTRLGREVAVKVLLAAASKDRGRLARFEREARAASALNHPNIVTIYEFGEAGGVVYLVMEWIDGVTLRDRVSEGPLPARELLSFGASVAEGLAKAHAAGIVHRDLKPENVMVTRDGLVKVLDFGLAKILYPESYGAEESSTLTAPLTAEGTVMGTIAYMSPEQATGQAVDFRSDVFSFGSILYEMAAGRSPFKRPSHAETLAAILKEEPPPLGPAGRDLPPSFEVIVRRCLEKDPERRYGSTRDLAYDLERLGAIGSSSPGVGGRQLPRSPLDTRSPAITSVAVIPFSHSGASPDTEYLGDGVTHGIISSLSRLPNLAVSARSSVAHYRGRDVDPQTVRKELGVEAVLTGEVISRGSDLTIRTELVDARTRRVLWGDEYRRTASDLLAIQVEIVRDLMEKLRPRFAGEEKHRLTRPPTTSTEAWEAYLKGRYFWNRRPRDTAKGMAHLEEAVRKDPFFALAHAALSECFMTLGAWENGTVAPKEAFPKAKSEALTALEIDGSLGEPHAPLAYTALHFDWDWIFSEREFRKAIELAPTYDNAHHWYSHLLTALGRKEESLAESREALTLGPLDIILNVHLAWHHQMFREFDQALEWARKSADLDQNAHWCPYFSGLAYEGQGRFDEAIAELGRAVTLSNGSTVMKSALGHAFASSGRRAEARAVLDELTNLRSTRYVSAYEIGLIHLALGEPDEGFRRLEDALQERSAWLPYLNAEPRLDPFRTDPRLMDLVARVGLPQ